METCWCSPGASELRNVFSWFLQRNRDEVPSADQPSSPHVLPEDWHLVGVGRSHRGEAARERQLLLPTEGRVELGGDGSDLWNLERQVEQLELRVGQVEEKTCTCNSSSHRAEPDEQLQAEVRWLKRGLEEHLRVFKNVFRNTDVLMASDAALDLDQLWHLLKREGGKRERRRGAGGGNPRNRRESPGAPPVLSDQSEISLVFVGERPRSVSNFLVFRSSLSQSLFGSSFTAPVGGVYLFVLTLDLSPGPAHVVLRRGRDKAQVSLLQQEVMEVGPVTGVGLLLLKEGEQVRLELRGGVWGESEDNVFTGLLLHQTT
ncbi:hypothetical protein INR49_007317 [Caranx melampygus]|nr:hypothetical protein INR49_007317 [Caranx melampygus]